MDKETIPSTPFIIIFIVCLLMLLVSLAISQKQNQIDSLENKIKCQHEQIQELKHKLNKLEIEIIKWKNFGIK